MPNEERGALLTAVVFLVVAVAGYLTESFPNYILAGDVAVALLATGKLAWSRRRTA